MAVSIGSATIVGRKPPGVPWRTPLRLTVAVVGVLAALAVAGCAVAPTTGGTATPPAGSPAQPKEKPVSTRTNMSNAQVKREGGKVWIADVPALSWAKSGDITFAGALASALTPTLHPYDDTQVMGYSGLAFRSRWGPRDKGWCPSIPVGEFPEESGAVSKATGWAFRHRERMAAGKDAHMEQFAAEMTASIDAGLPIVGYANAGLNCGVAYGYEDGGKTFLWRDYFKGDQEYKVPATDTGPWLMFLADYRQPPSEHDKLVTSLKIAAANWRRPAADPGGGKYYYLWGEQATNAWMQDLADAGSFTEEQQKSLFFANWWCFEAYVYARCRAAAFLSDNAKALQGDSAKAVEQAAAIYQKQSKLLLDGFWSKEVFIGPWTGKKQADWTPEMRAREQKLLADALELDRAAITEIEKALAAEGVK